MKVFRCDYIPHTTEDSPEVISYLFGYLEPDEVEAYNKHSAHSPEMAVAYLEKLLSNSEEDDRLYDEDIYYYLHAGVDEGESLSAIQADPDKFNGCPQFGDIYRGLVYDDDLTIVIEQVYES